MLFQQKIHDLKGQKDHVYAKITLAYEVKKCPAQKVAYWVWLNWQNIENVGVNLKK